MNFLSLSNLSGLINTFYERQYLRLHRPHTSKLLLLLLRVVGYYGDRLLVVAVGYDDGGNGQCRSVSGRDR